MRSLSNKTYVLRGNRKFNGKYIMVNKSTFNENMKNHGLLNLFLESNKPNGKYLFGKNYNGTFYVNTSNYNLVIYYFTSESTWFIQDLEIGVTDEFTFYCENCYENGIPSYSWKPESEGDNIQIFLEE